MKIGFFGALTLIFIVLKLTGTIAISWVWCVAPIFIPLGIIVCVVATPFIVLGFAALVCWVKEKLEDRKAA